MLALGLGLGDSLDGEGDGDVVGSDAADALSVGVPLGLGDALAVGSLVEGTVVLTLDVGVPEAAGVALVAAGRVRARRWARKGYGQVTALRPGTAAVTLATQGFTGGGEEEWLTRNMPSMDEANEIPTTTLTPGYVTRCVLIDAPSP